MKLYIIKGIVQSIFNDVIEFRFNLGIVIHNKISLVADNTYILLLRHCTLNKAIRKRYVTTPAVDGNIWICFVFCILSKQCNICVQTWSFSQIQKLSSAPRSSLIIVDFEIITASEINLKLLLLIRPQRLTKSGTPNILFVLSWKYDLFLSTRLWSSEAAVKKYPTYDISFLWWVAGRATETDVFLS